MRMAHRTLVGGLAAAVVLGCAAQQTPVRLEGDPNSIARLAGTWVGEYWGGAGGRGGSLTFALRTGTDSLFGDVTMVDQRGQLLRPADPMETHVHHVGSPQQLRIDVVQVQADEIRGVLEPYVSPDCDCTVTTTFLGRAERDRIAGTFSTRGGGRELAEGRWELKRSGGTR